MSKLKLLSKTRWILHVNLLFVLVFLNIWDFVTSKEIFNAMALGIFLFGIPALLWFICSFRAAMLNTLISIFEFTILLVFVLESFELGGAMTGASKSLFWLPYLLLAAFNAFWGLRIYAKSIHRSTRVQSAKVQKA